MDKETAETVVRIYAMFTWISAAVLLAVAFGITFFGTGIRSMMGYNYSSTMMGTTSAFVSVVLFIFAVFFVITGIGLWGMKPWGRSAAIVYSAISLLSFPFGTFVGAFGIPLFCCDKDIKKLL